MSYIGPREACGLGLSQFLFLVLRQWGKLLNIFKSLILSGIVSSTLLPALVIYAFWAWIISLSYFFYLWPLFITWFLSCILYLVFFSYIDCPLDTESDFCVLNDLRLIFSLYTLFLSNHDIQLEKGKKNL